MDLEHRVCAEVELVQQGIRCVKCGAIRKLYGGQLGLNSLLEATARLEGCNQQEVPHPLFDDLMNELSPNYNGKKPNIQHLPTRSGSFRCKCGTDLLSVPQDDAWTQAAGFHCLQDDKWLQNAPAYYSWHVASLFAKKLGLGSKDWDALPAVQAPQSLYYTLWSEARADAMQAEDEQTQEKKLPASRKKSPFSPVGRTQQVPIPSSPSSCSSSLSPPRKSVNSPTEEVPSPDNKHDVTLEEETEGSSAPETKEEVKPADENDDKIEPDEEAGEPSSPPRPSPSPTSPGTTLSYKNCVEHYQTAAQHFYAKHSLLLASAMQENIEELQIAGDVAQAPAPSSLAPSTVGLGEADSLNTHFDIMSAKSNTWHTGVVRTYSTGSKLYVGGGGAQELIPMDADYVISAVNSQYYQDTNKLVIAGRDEEGGHNQYVVTLPPNVQQSHSKDNPRWMSCNFLFYEDRAQIRDAVKMVRRAIMDGKNVFVHCIGGNHRAPVLSAAIIMITEGIKFIDAVQVVTAAKPCRIDQWFSKITSRAQEAARENRNQNTVQDWVIYWWQFAASGEYLLNQSVSIGYVAQNNTHHRFRIPRPDTSCGLSWECRLECVKPPPKFNYFAITKVSGGRVADPSASCGSNQSSTPVLPPPGQAKNVVGVIGAKVLSFFKRVPLPDYFSYTVPTQTISQAWSDLASQDLRANFTFLCNELNITPSATGSNPLTARNLMVILIGSLVARLPAHGTMVNVMHVECLTFMVAFCTAFFSDCAKDPARESHSLWLQLLETLADCSRRLSSFYDCYFCFEEKDWGTFPWIRGDSLHETHGTPPIPSFLSHFLDNAIPSLKVLLYHLPADHHGVPNSRHQADYHAMSRIPPDAGIRWLDSKSPLHRLHPRTTQAAMCTVPKAADWTIDDQDAHLPPQSSCCYVGSNAWGMHSPGTNENHPFWQTKWAQKHGGGASLNPRYFKYLHQMPNFPFLPQHDAFTKEQLDMMNAAIVSDSMLLWPADFERNQSDASFTHHHEALLRIEGHLYNRVINAMHGIISIFREAAMPKYGKWQIALVSGATSTYGLISLSTIVAYLNGETEWFSCHLCHHHFRQCECGVGPDHPECTPTRTIWHRLKDRERGKSMLYERLEPFRCALRVGLPRLPRSSTLPSPYLPYNVFVTATWTVKTLLAFLMRTAGSTGVLTMRPGKADPYVSPVGIGFIYDPPAARKVHGNCIAYENAVSWMPWPSSLASNAPIHPYEVPYFTYTHWLPLLRFDNLESVHPLFGAEQITAVDHAFMRAVYESWTPEFFWSRSQGRVDIANARPDYFLGPMPLSRTRQMIFCLSELSRSELADVWTRSKHRVQAVFGKHMPDWKQDILQYTLNTAMKLAAERTETLRLTCVAVDPAILPLKILHYTTPTRYACMHDTTYSFRAATLRDLWVIFGAPSFGGAFYKEPWSQEEALCACSADLAHLVSLRLARDMTKYQAFLLRGSIWTCISVLLPALTHGKRIKQLLRPACPIEMSLLGSSR